MNKKAQLDYPIITFAIIIVGLMILAPIILKIFMTTQSSFSAAIGNVSSGGDIAQTNFNAVMTPAINFWDKVIIAAFALVVILLFVSAFFIDASPFFIILYVFASFMLILFAPNIIAAVDHIYESANFAAEVSKLTFMDTLRSHYAEFLVGIMVITGIIIYGKIALFGKSNRGRTR